VLDGIQRAFLFAAFRWKCRIVGPSSGCHSGRSISAEEAATKRFCERVNTWPPR
jgi:hypothetical protein